MKNTKGFEKLSALKSKLDEEKMNETKSWLANLRKEELSIYSKRGFKSSQELISYLENGGTIVCTHIPSFEDYMKMVNGVVCHTYLEYNDVDCPIGMTTKRLSPSELKDWLDILEKGKDDHYGYIPCWIREV